MNLDDAARATRKYRVVFDPVVLDWTVVNSDVAGEAPVRFWSSTKSQAACDRLNLAAVLEAIREPSDAMLTYVAPEEDPAKAHWLNMIDVLIADVRG